MSIAALLVDDDARLPALLKSFLEPQGVDLTTATGGAAALDTLERHAFDVVILDVMMPGIDGLETLRRIRARSSVPVLMLTARGDETDRIVGLELGADDYLPKPFNPRELLARIRALMRRSQPVASAERLEFNGIRAEVDTRQVWRLGAPVSLTALEFDLLVALMRRRGRVIPRAMMLREAGRGDVAVSERTVDVHVARLRQKLDDDPPQLIKTVRGVGYVFAPVSDALV
ncbi:MAG TPA: response regulator transcription factor [Vicinamibacterales bacterium]|nr:response regulator transcription factor [Vicinamibacterales bacterium]